MNDTEVRRASVEDAADLAAVYRSAYRENRDLGFPAKAESATGEEVAGWIREYRVFVATVDGAVVGGVRLETPDDGPATVGRLGVHEDWKGAGIGTRLLDRAEGAARERGHDELRLTTPEEHPYLPGFYQRRGYEERGPYPLEYRDYDEMLMAKRLR
ncbi:N-acetyltransferase [Halobacteriales archaeon QS_8_69_26]|nr:MAG: N-acetyltransferase [Halobacteriales archaeon QS_8_69_26]